MDRTKVLAVVTKKIQDITGDDSPIREDQTLSEVGIDSLDMVDVVFELEQEFMIDIDEEALNMNDTIKVLVDFVASCKPRESKPRMDTVKKRR